MLQPKDTDCLNGYKNKTIYMLPTRNPLETSRHIQTESERMEKYVPCKWDAKESWSAYQTKQTLKYKKVARDKEGHYIMIKGLAQEEDITIVNVYAPNIGAHQYIRQTLTDKKGETASNTIIVGDLKTPLIPMDRSSKQN